MKRYVIVLIFGILSLNVFASEWSDNYNKNTKDVIEKIEADYIKTKQDKYGWSVEKQQATIDNLEKQRKICEEVERKRFEASMAEHYEIKEANMVEDNILFVIGFIILSVSIFIYFLPTWISAERKHKNADSILIINLFLGWTLIGWVIALAWALIKD